MELVVALNNQNILGERFRIYVYEEFTTPSVLHRLSTLGLRVEDANSVVDSSMVFPNPDRPSFSGFSNIFRYKALDLLTRQGPAVWLDLDYALLTESDFSHIFAGYESKKVVNGAVFGINGAPAREFNARLLDLSEDRAKTNFQWGELGPRLITGTLLSEFPELASEVRTPKAIYPVPYRFAEQFWSPDHSKKLQMLVGKANGFHLWNECYRGLRNGPRNTRPHQASFVAHHFKNELSMLDDLGLLPVTTMNKEIPKSIRSIVRPNIAQRLFRRFAKAATNLRGE